MQTEGAVGLRGHRGRCTLVVPTEEATMALKVAMFRQGGNVAGALTPPPGAPCTDVWSQQINATSPSSIVEPSCEHDRKLQSQSGEKAKLR